MPEQSEHCVQATVELFANPVRNVPEHDVWSNTLYHIPKYARGTWIGQKPNGKPRTGTVAFERPRGGVIPVKVCSSKLEFM